MPDRAGPPLRRADVLALAAGLGAAAGVSACGTGRFDVPPAPGLSAPRASQQRDAASGPPASGTFGFDRDAQLTAGTAYLRYDPTAQAWTLGNERFQEQIELRPAGTVGFHLVRRHLRSLEREIRADVADVADVAEEPGAAQDATLDALGVAIDGAWPALLPVDQRLERLADGALYGALRFLEQHSGAVLTAELRLRPGHPVVEHRVSVHHRGREPLRLTRLDGGNLVIASSPDARWRAATLDNQGNSYLARLGRDGVLEAETPAQSAARAPVVPLLILHDVTADEGLFFGLRWSANYRITARYLGERRVGVEAGIRMSADPRLDPPEAVQADPGFSVPPGETVVGPWLILGFFDGGIEAAANALKRYLTDDRPRDPSWSREVLPVAWNSWFAYGQGVDYPSMLDEARQARRLGVEVFYVDHGWQAAIGDWRPHPQRFPGRTLRGLSEEVHRMGLRFGLWVAFGVADADSELLRRHPDFLAQQPRPARTGIDGSLPLCLHRAQSWLRGELGRVVREYRLDWLKFDQPMIAACGDAHHGHDPSVRGSLQANNQAFYDLLGDLRQRFPELLIESTFDGAGYLDYGVFARSHTAWLDDAAGDPSVPMPVVQQSFYGASLAFPARFLTLWLARGPVEGDAPGRGMAPEDLAYQGYSTMGGGWGLSLRLGDLDEPQRQVVRELIEDYRRLREILPGAEIYHLEPGLSVPPPATRGPAVEDWFVLQYVQPELRRGAILAVRNGGPRDELRVRLRGLTPQSPYQVTWSDGRRLAEALGQVLMRDGIAVALPPYSGGLIWVTPTA